VITVEMSVLRAPEAKSITTEGSARRANKNEVRGAGLPGVMASCLALS
jgi:hypothetical protein